MKKTIQKLKRLGAFDSKELAEDIQELLCDVPQTATVEDIQKSIEAIADTIENITPYTKDEVQYRGIVGVCLDVEDRLGLDRGSILIKTRKREIVEARQIAHTAVKKYFPSVSLAYIGEKIGILDHSTVLNSVKVVNNLIYTDKVFREKYEVLIKLYNLDK